MAKRRVRREGRRGRSVSDDISDVARGLVYAQAEGMAAAADVARRFWSRLLDDDFLYDSETEGEVVRRTPRAVERASRNIVRDVTDIPDRMLDVFYDEYHRERRRGTRRSGEREGRSSRSSGGTSRSSRARSERPEQDIVDAAQDYLDRLPARAATERGLIDHVTLATDREKETVRAIIRRHFVIDDGLVRDEARSSTVVLEDDVELRMRNILKDAGYTEIRYNVRLPELDDDETAALVAYEGGRPAVVCYPVGSGVDDPAVREAAQVQALVIEDGPARYIWVSDGRDDYYRDVENDVAIESLPRAGSQASQTTSGGGRASSRPQATSPGGSGSAQRQGQTETT